MNGVRELLSRSAARVLGRPSFLVFFVTSRCNLRCGHCLLHGLPAAGAPEDEELTLDEITRIVGTLPSLRTLSFTGGEPFLREDLGRIAEAFIRARKVQRVILVTNGWFVDRVLQTASGLLATEVPRLAIRVSLDGPSEIHDRIRKAPGAHDRAVETIRGLGRLASRDERLEVGTITTCQDDNRAVLSEYLGFVRSLRPHTVSLIADRDAAGRPRDRALEQNGFVELFGAYQSANPSAFRRAYKSLVLEMQLGHRSAACQAGQLVAVLRENGDLYPCESLDRRMASLREHDLDFRAAWESPGADAVRRFANRSCTACTWDCVLPFNIVCSPPLLGSLLLRTATGRFGGVLTRKPGS